MLFLRIPRANEFKRVFKGLRFEVTSQVPVLYLSIVAFYVSSGIFNTSLVPSLTANRITGSEVFAVSVVGMVVQTVSFMYVTPYIAKRSLVRTAVGGLALSICMLRRPGIERVFHNGNRVYRSNSHFLSHRGWCCLCGILYRVKYNGVSLNRIKECRLLSGGVQRSRWRREHGWFIPIRIYLGLLWIPYHVSACCPLPCNLGGPHL